MKDPLSRNAAGNALSHWLPHFINWFFPEKILRFVYLSPSAKFVDTRNDLAIQHSMQTCRGRRWVTLPIANFTRTAGAAPLKFGQLQGWSCSHRNARHNWQSRYPLNKPSVDFRSTSDWLAYQWHFFSVELHRVDQLRFHLFLYFRLKLFLPLTNIKS